jgi:hypothetical protein
MLYLQNGLCRYTVYLRITAPHGELTSVSVHSIHLIIRLYRPVWQKFLCHYKLSLVSVDSTTLHMHIAGTSLSSKYKTKHLKY